APSSGRRRSNWSVADKTERPSRVCRVTRRLLSLSRDHSTVAFRSPPPTARQLFLPTLVSLQGSAWGQTIYGSPARCRLMARGRRAAACCSKESAGAATSLVWLRRARKTLHPLWQSRSRAVDCRRVGYVSSLNLLHRPPPVPAAHTTERPVGVMCMGLAKPM